MEPKEIIDELKTILVERLRFDPKRTADMPPDTSLPKGVEGSLGLDSLDFIELSVAIEERFDVVFDEREDLAPHFQTLDTLSRYIAARISRT